MFCELSKAMAHAELAAVSEDYSPESADFKARCVSYVLGKEFGVDVSGYDFSDIPDHLRDADPQTIRGELSDIRDTAFDLSAKWFAPWSRINPQEIKNRSVEYGKQEKRILTLDRYEHGVVINALNEMRNDLIEEERPTDIVDEVLLKAIDAPTKKARFKDNEARE